MITNPGLGYTIAPSVLVQPPAAVTEQTGLVGVVTGFSGIITSISANSGVGIITFKTERVDGFDNYNGLGAGDYIFVNKTKVGNGVTSLNETGISTVSIGTTFIDNIYQVKTITNSGAQGSIECFGIVSTSLNSNNFTGAGDNLGQFSFGELSSINRGSSPISIGVTGLTVDSGLSTFPTIQRSGGDYTLRKTGALPKTP